MQSESRTAKSIRDIRTITYLFFMGKYSRLGKNALFMFVGSIGSKVLTFLMLPFYTSYLSVGDYGTVDLIMVYVTLLTSIVTCCLTEAIFVFPKDRPSDEQKSYFTSGFLFSAGALLLAGLLFAVSANLLRSADYNGIFAEYNVYIFLTICTTYFQSYTQQFARSIGKVKIYVISGIILTLSTVLLSLWLLPSRGITGYIYAMVFAPFITTVYTVLAGREYAYFSPEGLSKGKLLEMLKYSIPMIPNSVIFWILGTLNRPLLAHYSGIDSVGILAVANKFPALLTMIYGVFAYSWQISVLEEFRSEDYRIFYNRIFRIFLLVLSLCVLGITLLSRPLIEMMTTPEYYEASLYVPCLSLAVAFSNMAGFVGTNFSATKESKHYFSTSVWGGGACILMNFLFIPLSGIWGAVISILLSNALILLLRLKITWKYASVLRWHIHISVLFVVGAYMALSFFIENTFLNMLCFLSALSVIMFLNRDYLHDAFAVFRKIRK